MVEIPQYLEQFSVSPLKRDPTPLVVLCRPAPSLPGTQQREPQHYRFPGSRDHQPQPAAAVGVSDQPSSPCAGELEMPRASPTAPAVAVIDDGFACKPPVVMVMVMGMVIIMSHSINGALYHHAHVIQIACQGVLMAPKKAFVPSRCGAQGIATQSKHITSFLCCRARQYCDDTQGCMCTYLIRMRAPDC